MPNLINFVSTSWVRRRPLRTVSWTSGLTHYQECSSLWWKSRVHGLLWNPARAAEAGTGGWTPNQSPNSVSSLLGGQRQKREDLVNTNGTNFIPVTSLPQRTVRKGTQSCQNSQTGGAAFFQLQWEQGRVQQKPSLRPITGQISPT